MRKQFLRKISEDLYLYETDEEEYDRLVEFSIKNDLEFTEEDKEEVDTDIIQCYKVTDKDDKLIGCAILAVREDAFILDGIAVDPAYRNKKIGEAMLDEVIAEAKRRGGSSIYLVARAPGFFKKNNFKTLEVNPEDAPNFFECKYCPQYMNSCHPEVMEYRFN